MPCRMPGSPDSPGVGLNIIYIKINIDIQKGSPSTQMGDVLCWSFYQSNPKRAPCKASTPKCLAQFCMVQRRKIWGAQHLLTFLVRKMLM